MNRFFKTAALGLGLVGLTGCTATTESTEVGVRVAKMGLVGTKGVQPEVYPQGGTYFFFRPLSDWYVFDVGLQNLEMLREPNEGDRGGDDSLRFKTVDGNDISVNVTIAWSLDAGNVPYILQFLGDSTREVEQKLVRPVSRTVVRDTLNQLTSEDFYVAQRRFQMSEEAKRRLNLILSSEGVIIENVLLGEHKFNQTYEQIIRDKKVAEQETSRLTSETEAAREEMKRDLERARGAVSQTLEKASGEAARRQLEADAIYFERERQAQAIVSEKAATAQGLTERAKALSGSGGKAMVKLAVAEALLGKKILFVPAGSGVDMRTTDMNSLLELYGAKSLSK